MHHHLVHGGLTCIFALEFDFEYEVTECMIGVGGIGSGYRANNPAYNTVSIEVVPNCFPRKFCSAMQTPSSALNSARCLGSGMERNLQAFISPPCPWCPQTTKAVAAQHSHWIPALEVCAGQSEPSSVPRAAAVCKRCGCGTLYLVRVFEYYGIRAVRIATYTPISRFEVDDSVMEGEESIKSPAGCSQQGWLLKR